MARDRGWKPVAEDPSWANWQAPVVLRINAHRKQIISNPAEALAFLLVRWTGVKDDSHEAARKACSGVFRRRVDPEDARAVFLLFADRAGLLD